MVKLNFLTDTPIMDQFYGSPAYESHEDQPERSRVVDGEEYMTVAEYMRRVDPLQYPVVEGLVSASGFDRTYIVLGQIAAKKGRLMKVEPVKMFHPEYESVNGWPVQILNEAWRQFKYLYAGKIRWLDRDPEPPSVPEPVGMPPPSMNPRLFEQIRAYAERKGAKFTAAQDPRWRGAMAIMLEARESETPQQALIRRTSAAAVMHAVEVEYERR